MNNDDWFPELMKDVRKTNPLQHFDLSFIIALSWVEAKRKGNEWEDVIEEVAVLMQDILDY